MGEAVNIDRMNCKLIPKDQHEWILQNGSGWNYPDGIWVGVCIHIKPQNEVVTKRYM